MIERAEASSQTSPQPEAPTPPDIQDVSSDNPAPPNISKACLESLVQIAQVSAKNKFNYRLQSKHPDLSKSQCKVLFKLFEARQTNVTPDNPTGFSGGMSTEKYAAISGVSRATAYRELTDLVAQQVLTISGQGRGTRYALV